MSTNSAVPRNLFLVQVCVGLLLKVLSINAYNLDTRSPVIHRGKNGTFFGFSVALHRDFDEDMLIVGAPQDDSSELGTPYHTTGAVYKCPVEPFDNPGNCVKITTEAYEHNRNKTNQWLGATVRSSGPNGTVLSCAPLSKEERFSQVQPSGKCIFSTSSMTHHNDQAPCKPKLAPLTGFKHTTHCLAGTSADIYKDGYIIGGPGSYHAQGSIFVPNEEGDFIHSEDEGIAHDGNYQGYSVAFGNFSGGDRLDYITGIPRAENLQGVVRIYSPELGHIRGFRGYQAGSFFGQSVAGNDLNDDGFDDLIVGASSYWNREAHQIDVGQIYIYYQTSLGTFDELPTVITGQVDGGRFGFVVAPLGDINDDGVNDLAVSAPYDGSGAVYIYNGRKMERIKNKPVQVVRPSDFNVNIPMERFGFALAGQRDADKNLYPDLLVGSYESDSAILIRTKPVVRPFISLSFTSNGVNVTNRNIRFQDKLVSGFEGETCLNYSGMGTDEFYFFNIRITMDAEKQTSRALFYNESTSYSEIQLEQIRIPKNGPNYCYSFTAYLKDEIIDKVSPIIVRVTTEVIIDEESLFPGEISHVVDLHNKIKDAQIQLFVDCLNERCSPNLILSVKSDKTTLYFGDNTQVGLIITVANIADEAFGAHLYAEVPDVARLSSFRPIKSDLSILCEHRLELGGVVCDIGNPLPKETEIVFEMQFQIESVPGDRESLTISLMANSTTEEETRWQSDNNQTITFNLQPKIGITLDGSANVDQVIFNDTATGLPKSNYTHASEIGDKVVHTYWVQNIGPAEISTAELEVKWPLRNNDGEFLLYLTAVSISDGQSCTYDQGALNPYDLVLDEDSLNSTRVSETAMVQDLSRRKKRASHEKTTLAKSATEASKQADVDCSDTHEGCVKVTCQLRNLRKDATNVILKMESRLWVENLLEDKPRSWNIVSRARVVVNSLPYIITQPSKPIEMFKELSLQAIPMTLLETQPVPLWAIILSISLGILFLIIIAATLWKVGFFKRKKPDYAAAQIVHPTDQPQEAEMS